MRDLSRISLRHGRLGVALALLGLSACVAACVAPSDAPSDEIGVQRGAVLDVCATAPEGALCDDKNVCTIFDVCKAGVCKGSAAPNGTLCTDGNVCTANDSCRAGFCMGDAVPDLTACTDGDPCTVGDACKAGVCLSGKGTLTCDDGIACTLDICVAGAGCVFSPVGDCSIPKDAGPEAPPPDGRPGNDGAGDAMMSGGDGASERGDGPSLADVMSEAAPGDTGALDTRPPVDAPNDTAFDASPDGAADAPGADATDGAADVDAADAPPVDAADGSADADAALPTLPVLRASGGACTCATGTAPRPRWTIVALGLVGLLARRRASRRGRALSRRHD